MTKIDEARLDEKALEAATHHIGGGSTFDHDERLEIAEAVVRAYLSAIPQDPVAPNGGVGLFLLSASLTKHHGVLTTTNSMQGYRFCDTEDEARDSFSKAVATEKPGFVIQQLLCMRVPDDAIRSALLEAKDPP